MAGKQIIIDDVDVSGCISLDKSYIPNCTEEFIDCELGGLYEYQDEYKRTCKENPNCYYKQLARKEQECEKYKQTLIEIKEIAEKVYNDCDNCYRNVDTNYDVDCIDCTLGSKAKLAEQILQKISEVL